MRELADCVEPLLIMQVAEIGNERQSAPPCSFPTLSVSESFSADYGDRRFAVTLGYKGSWREEAELLRSVTRDACRAHDAFYAALQTSMSGGGGPCLIVIASAPLLEDLRYQEADSLLRDSSGRASGIYSSGTLGGMPGFAYEQQAYDYWWITLGVRDVRLLRFLRELASISHLMRPGRHALGRIPARRRSTGWLRKLARL